MGRQESVELNQCRAVVEGACGIQSTVDLMILVSPQTNIIQKRNFRVKGQRLCSQAHARPQHKEHGNELMQDSVVIVPDQLAVWSWVDSYPDVNW